MLQIVENPSYDGAEGVRVIAQLRKSMCAALKAENWLELQRLDKTCSAVVAKVLACENRDFDGLQLELTILKSIYWRALSECQERAGGPDAIEILQS